MTKHLFTALALVSLTATVAVAGGDKADKMGKMGDKMGSFDKSMIQSWPTESRTAADNMIAKHGQPHEFTSSMLRWNDVGQFEHIVVEKEAVEHQFPMAHKDVLKHVISYKVPADKMDELAQFDGSLLVDRTKGTLAARCDREESNLAALNLADEIVKGKKTAQQARDTMAKIASQMAMKNGKPQGELASYAQGLKFQVAPTGTADPDRATAMGK